MGVVSLIVMEAGSRWPGHVRESENVVVSAHATEGVVERTHRVLAQLRQHGKQVRIAVLACNGSVDAAALACRTELARALLEAVVAAGFGRLVLSSEARASMPVRRHLLSLAGALSHQLRGTSVRVKFDETAGAGVRDGVPSERGLRRLMR